MILTEKSIYNIISVILGHLKHAVSEMIRWQKCVQANGEAWKGNREALTDDGEVLKGSNKALKGDQQGAKGELEMLKMLKKRF